MENPKPNHVSKLNDVVDRLISTLLPKACSNKSFFVNDIPNHLEFKKESPVVTSVLGGLLSTVISNATNSCIWLSAKLYGNVVVLHVKNAKGFNPHIIRGQLRQLQALAEKRGGTIGFARDQNTVTSLTFGFYP